MTKKQVSLYLTEDVIKKSKILSIEKGFVRVNDFYVKAIEDAIEKASEGQIELKLN